MSQKIADSKVPDASGRVDRRAKKPPFLKGYLKKQVRFLSFWLLEKLAFFVWLVMVDGIISLCVGSQTSLSV
jgi:hypothetical protein